MALRNIREIGDPILQKTAKPVKEVNWKIKTLIGDMLDTMYEAGGVGLAAPQVGMLKQVVVIDVSEEGNDPVILINPELLDSSGEQSGYEGCLSLPGKSGIVTRPNYAKVKAWNENMEEIIVEGDELLARALCHELDHLEGHVYVERVEGELVDNSELEQESEERKEREASEERHERKGRKRGGKRR